MLEDLESAKKNINDLLSYYIDLNEDLKSTSSSEEEQTTILYDLLGPIYAKYITFQDLHTDIILRTRLYKRLADYLSFPSNASISCLILELKSIQKNTSMLHKIRHNKKISSSNHNLQKYILNDLAVLDKVLELIVRHTPKGHDILEILFQEHIGKKADFNLKYFVKQLVSPKEHIEFIKNYSFHKSVQNQDQKKSISSEAKDESTESIYIQYCMNRLKDLIDKKAPLIEQLIIMLSSTIESSQPMSEDDTIEYIVITFFRQWAVIDRINTKIESTMKEVSLLITKITYQCNNDLAIKNLELKLFELVSTFKRVNDAFNDHFKSSSLKDCKIDIKEVLLIKKQGMAIKETLDHLNRKVNLEPSLFDEFLETHKDTPLAEFVKHVNETFNAEITIKQTESGIEKLSQSIFDYEKTIESFYQPDSPPPPLLLSNPTTDYLRSELSKLHIKMETDAIKESAFEEIHKQKTIQWIAQFEEKREQKKSEKKQAQIPTNPNPNDSPSFSGILDKVYKLKKKNKIILHNIYFRQSDVSFENIESLVTALEGKVVSNKGSHHTIILRDHSSFIISKGTVVKPHGSSHTSGKLCRFNLKRVASCFERAGIAAQVVSNLLDKDPRNDVGQSIALRH